MKRIVIGTAGHVDHGKTTLIRALTGIDTDRLEEEQRRGMTIDLGFAHLVLPDGSVAGIIDVPGHERFLRNMLAGASGIDLALLVVAGDEGFMPQTQEHLDALCLFGLSHGIIVVTRVGLAESEWLGIVEEDIRTRVRGTFLADAPIVRVDSITGKGIPRLKREIHAAVSRASERSADAPARLPIDRAFTMQGFGAVVTGTLIAGRLQIGDAVAIQPGDRRARVRGLQTHGKKATVSSAGTRVAVNLAGIEADSLQRGDVLSAPGSVLTTRLIDASMRVIAGSEAPVRHRQRVRVHVGAAESIGRLRVLGADMIAPGEAGYVQFLAESPMAAAPGDHFVVRTYSPMVVVAGGVILDATPTLHRRTDPATVADLVARAKGTPADQLEAWLARLPLGALRRDVAPGASLSPDAAEQATAKLIEDGRIVALSAERVIHTSALQTALARLSHALALYHAASPLRPGMPKEELRAAIGRDPDTRAFAALLHHARWRGLIDVDGAIVRAAGFEVAFSPRQQALYNRVMALLEADLFQPPTPAELSLEAGAPPDAISAMLRVGQERGHCVAVAPGVYFHTGAIVRAREIISEIVSVHGSVTAGQFRDASGGSRKYAVPLLEYLDSVRFTRRAGDARVLADQQEGAG